MAKLDNETRTVTRQLRRELAEVRAELDAQTTRANTANLLTKQASAIAKERKQEIARLQQTEREYVSAVTAHKRKERELTQSLASLRSELKNAVGNAATTNKLHDLQLQELDEELYAVKLQEQKEKDEITRRTMIIETTLKEQYSQAMAALEAAAEARQQNQKSIYAQREKSLKDAHQKEVTRLDAKIRNVTHDFRRELVESDLAHKQQIIQETSRVEAEALSAKQAHAAAKEYEQKILQLQQREKEKALSMAVARQKEIQLTQQLRSELDVAMLKAADTSKLNSMQLQQAAEDISRKIVVAEAALKMEHRQAVADLEAAAVVRESKLKSVHAQIEQSMANAHREEVAKLDNETRTVTRQLRRELAEVRAELLVDAQTTRANTATEKHENISMSEYKLGVQNSRQSSQQSLHHLAWRREQTLQQNQQQCSSYVGVDVPIAPDAVRDRCKGTSRSVSSQVSSYRFRTQESQWSKAKPIPITPVRGHSSRCSPTSIDTYAKEFAVNHVDPLSTPKHRQQRDERTQELLVWEYKQAMHMLRLYTTEWISAYEWYLGWKCVRKRLIIYAEQVRKINCKCLPSWPRSPT